MSLSGVLRFTKKDIDDGYKDKRLADDFYIDLYFEQGQVGYVAITRVSVQVECSANSKSRFIRIMSRSQSSRRAFVCVGGSRPHASAESYIEAQGLGRSLDGATGLAVGPGQFCCRRRAVRSHHSAASAATATAAAYAATALVSGGCGV